MLQNFNQFFNYFQIVQLEFFNFYSKFLTYLLMYEIIMRKEFVILTYQIKFNIVLCKCQMRACIKILNVAVCLYRQWLRINFILCSSCQLIILALKGYDRSLSRNYNVLSYAFTSVLQSCNGNSKIRLLFPFLFSRSSVTIKVRWNGLKLLYCFNASIWCISNCRELIIEKTQSNVVMIKWEY